MSTLLHTWLKTNNGQALLEYLIVTVIIAISAGIAVNLVGHALSSYYGFLIAFISLPIP